MLILPGLEPIEPPPLDPRQLRDWWHEVIREHGYYPYYAILLAFSADAQVDSYLMQHAAELSRLSENKCLVIVYSDLGLVSLGPNLELWHLMLPSQVHEAHVARLAELFGVTPADFPCLIFSRRIPSRDEVIVSLKGMDQHEIADVVRSNLIAVEAALARKKDLRFAIEHNPNNRARLKSRNLLDQPGEP